MGLAIFSPAVSRPAVLAFLLAPFQELFALLGDTQNAPGNIQCTNRRIANPNCRRKAHPIDIAPWRTAAVGAAKAAPSMAEPVNTAPGAAGTSRLKVVRAFDPGIAPSCAGRMVISGRMADVCAELDRMAQKEASRRQD